ncbi:PAP_fibrillin domain-containing protein, partial [Haematococcus lacustris]
PSTTAAGIKAELLTSLRDTNRGIFGLPVSNAAREQGCALLLTRHQLVHPVVLGQAAKKNAILGLVTALEAETPVPSPTSCLELCAGRWRLLYSTITITGVKRTKLGLREFIRLGDFVQEIDAVHAEAVGGFASGRLKAQQ